MNIYELQPRFTALFPGLPTAFGTGKGQWIKRSPRPQDWLDHLEAKGPGIGIAPLRPDNTVMFAAIDLDEPDFAAAREMQSYLPGPSFVEQSRSGNAHVWVFFSGPVDAWIPMGVMKEACLAAGKKHVEVFPKNHDFAMVKLGNYINLPYHGYENATTENGHRPVMCNNTAPSAGRCPRHYSGPGGQMVSSCSALLTLPEFLDEAEAGKNDPSRWEQRTRLLAITPPSQRELSQEFGTQRNLHICAQALIDGDTGPISEGHRANVFFMLAKCLTNWEQVNSSEALDFMRSVNRDNCTEPVPDSELIRILGNAERGRFTSTGCDDPVVEPFTHPDCPILRNL